MRTTAPAPAADELAVAYAERLARLPEIYDRLARSPTVAALLATAAQEACAECGFSRGVVLTVHESQLHAAESDPLADIASDRLRRLVLNEPIAVSRELVEDALMGEPAQRPEAMRRLRAVLSERLALDQIAVGVLALESRPAALLVLDRREGAPHALDAALVTAFAAMLAVALRQVILHARIGEVATELRHVTAFTQALMAETLAAPLALPSPRGRSAVFPLVEATEPRARQAWREGFSDQEVRVARLLMRGLSNREIADELVLSTETVKSHVQRILRKLGVANRAQAVAAMLGCGGSV